MKLTEHFSLEEFERSSTAKAKGINNRVPENLIPSLKTLCVEVLEPLRSIVNEPIIISSGYRCPILNATVGGVPNSQHIKGEAADIHLCDIQKLRYWFTILLENGNFDQLILERASQKSNHWWIHVSCKPDPNRNRHQVIQGLCKTQ